MKMLEEEDAVFSYSPTISAEFKRCTKELTDGNAVAYKPEDSKPQVEWKPRPYIPSQTRLKPYAKEFASSSVSDPSTVVEKDSALSEDVLDRMALMIIQGFALPKPELATFDGNPLEYWIFIKSFGTIIESNAINESEKLMYLIQYTSGEAKTTIKSCLVMDSSVEYHKTARKLLEERFGHPFTIASTYVAKLTEGPPLKPSDRTGLLAFADQLKDCERTLESIGYLDEINSADNLSRIVKRLLFHLRTKFVEVADSIQQSGNRTNISHIAEFVKVKELPTIQCLVV